MIGAVPFCNRFFHEKLLAVADLSLLFTGPARWPTHRDDKMSLGSHSSARTRVTAPAEWCHRRYSQFRSSLHFGCTVNLVSQQLSRSRTKLSVCLQWTSNSMVWFWEMVTLKHSLHSWGQDMSHANVQSLLFTLTEQRRSATARHFGSIGTLSNAENAIPNIPGGRVFKLFDGDSSTTWNHVAKLSTVARGSNQKALVNSTSNY
jgi:hypothetical protein